MYEPSARHNIFIDYYKNTDSIQGTGNNFHDIETLQYLETVSIISHFYGFIGNVPGNGWIHFLKIRFVVAGGRLYS